MDMTQYVTKEATALIPIIYFLGYIIKKSPYIKDWLIPWILLFIAILFSISIYGLSTQAFVQGVLVVGVCTLSNQLYKQTLEGTTDSTNTTE